MAILALPLLASFLKHHTFRLSIRSRKPLSSSFCKSPYRRQFSKTCASAISPSTTLHHSSADSKSDGSKSSVLTFQQAIQRLQVIFPIPKCLFLVYFSAEEWRVFSYVMNGWGKFACWMEDICPLITFTFPLWLVSFRWIVSMLGIGNSAL